MYFRRELPFPPQALTRDPPRLRDARRLQESGAVRLRDDGRATVSSGGNDHAVRFAADGTPHCTCPWWSRHPGDRGPCKHVLAVVLERRLRPQAVRPAGSA